ncbi:uncharacterized protein LOC132272744 [Cornus florida]|uniref:uncharacterized protein LOC132272744 n=1 Tax=Cornus florida TaxID=4283 RepID=UPI00289A703C|nr:uncharacterized protein LOC132272744 [Cornus florida]
MSNVFSPLTAILKDNKEYKFVLTQECPPMLGPDDSQQLKEMYEKWQKADEMAKCYILASTSNGLQHQHQSFVTTRDILLNLKEMFGKQSRAAQQVAMKQIMNARMPEGTPVGEHLLKMISYFNELEVLGANIDGETQVDIILQSLPESFNQFKLNYSMNSMAYSLSKLMNALQAAEGIFKGQGSVHTVEKGSSSHGKPKGKNHNKKQGSTVPKKVGTSGGIVKAKGKAKIKGNCFHCGKEGH